jgi:hypothetical protein
MSVKVYLPSSLLTRTDPVKSLFLSQENMIWLKDQILRLVLATNGTYNIADIMKDMPHYMFQWLQHADKKELTKALKDHDGVPVMQLSSINRLFVRDNYKKFVINQTVSVAYNHKDIGVQDSNFRVESNLGLTPSGNAIPFNRTSLHCRPYDRTNEGLHQTQDWGSFGFRYNMTGLTHDRPGKYDTAVTLPFRNEYPVRGMGFETYHSVPVAYYGNGDTLDIQEGSLVKPDVIPPYS